MYVRNLLILFVVLFCLSCQSDDSKSEELVSSYDTISIKSSVSPVERSTALPDLEDSVLVTNSLITFKTIFLDRFSKDSLFQIDHIKFPLVNKGYKDNIETGEGDFYTELSGKDRWTMMNLKYDSSGFYQEYDRCTQEFEMKGNDSVKITYRGIDNGIYFGYIFAKDPVWKLVETWDFSN